MNAIAPLAMPIKPRHLSTRLSDKRRHSRINVHLAGRFMFQETDHQLRTVNVSCGGALLRVNTIVPIGERIICYFDDLGRLEANVVRQDDRHIAVQFQASQHKRDKLSDRLMWLLNRKKYKLADQRNAPRKAKVANAIVTTNKGDRVECKLIDISLTGAAFEKEGPPLTVGEIVAAGTLKGEVVRSDTAGFAVRFLKRSNA